MYSESFYPSVGQNQTTLATDPPELLITAERQRITEAAVRAVLLYPGLVGKFLARELTSLTVYGFRLDPSGLSARTVDEILNTPLPDPPVPAVQAA